MGSAAARVPRSCPSGSPLLALLPSLLALGILALIAQLGAAGEAMEAISPIQYPTLFPFVAVLVFLFCAAQAPELFGRDQRAGVLPLYFSRSPRAWTTRQPGPWACWVRCSCSCSAAAAPLRRSRPGRGGPPRRPRQRGSRASGHPRRRAHHRDVLVGSVSAAIAALTPRRAYATVAVIAIFLIPNSAAAMLGMRKRPMMATVAYERRGVSAAVAAETRPTTPPRRARRRSLRQLGQLLGEASHGVGGHQDAAHQQQQLRRQHQHQTARQQAQGPRRRVVEPESRPREVQRQDAGPLVAPEELGRLRGAEEEHEQRDEGEETWST